MDITLGTRHQIPADGSAVTIDGRDHRSLVQGSFGHGGCGNRRGCRCGRHACGEASRAVNLTLSALVHVGDVLTDSSAAIVGDRDCCLPFSDDRLTVRFNGVHGAPQAHKAEDDGLGDTHFADGDEVDEC